ncbi:helix-turn-helix domain-containing protein [Dyadobacter sp. 676]|uniref:Helix-turn-helix domain-containing protein n=1 Tax=Dyadobacter sp. 676 TaxID=3088362 RepID=A0AAU8FLG2_9BACT
MKHISIIVPLGQSSLVNIEGSLQILSEVNVIRQKKGQGPLFRIQLVGLAHQVPQRNGLFTIAPDVLITDVGKTDLIIIPSMQGDQAEAAEMNKDFIPWIIRQYNQGAEVAGLCIGAFLLAATGLLDGKPCTTHWMLADEFKRTYPKANLIPSKIISDQDGLYTSGGAFSYLNLLVHLIEKYAGREMAVRIAKSFVIDIDKPSQSPFIIFEGQKDHIDEDVKNAQNFIEQNYLDKITIDQLADRFAISRRSLQRRFLKFTNNTVNEYVQRVKVEAAKRKLESGKMNVSEVMYEVGYTDTKTFRDVFKKITGLTPADYRNKYNRQAVLD